MGNGIAQLGTYIKNAAPMLGAATSSALSAVGEPTLGLAVGAAVDSGVAEIATLGVTAYVAHSGITAAVQFYKDQNAKCH